MKAFKWLPVVAAVSLALTGCGSASKEGGGPTPPPAAEYYNFQFIQLIKTTTTPNSSCTIFAETTTGSSTQYTYAKLASDLTVEIHGSDGTFKKSYEVPSTGSIGYLRIPQSEVEEGGFVTIKDSPSEQDPFFKVLSIQKPLLSNHLISVARNQGSVPCYTAGKVDTPKSGYASVNNNGVIAQNFSYLSSKKDSGNIASNSFDTLAASDESVLVKSYDNSQITGHTFISTLTSAAFDTPSAIGALEATDGNKIWSDQTGSTLTSLSVYLNKGNYDYLWQDLNVNVPASFPFNSTEQNWYFTAKGSSNGWSYQKNGAVPANFDVALPTTLTLNNTSPSIQADVTGYTFKNDGVSTTNELVTRSYYTKANGTTSTLEHTIYAVSSDGDTKIPDLRFNNLTPQSPDSVKTSAYEVSKVTAEIGQIVMRNHESTDSVKEVSTPIVQVTQTHAVQSAEFTSISR